LSLSENLAKLLLLFNNNNVSSDIKICCIEIFYRICKNVNMRKVLSIRITIHLILDIILKNLVTDEYSNLSDNELKYYAYKILILFGNIGNR